MSTQVWLITGSSRGLVRAFTEAALKCRTSRCRLVATARNSDNLPNIASEYGERVRTVSLDVRDEAQARYAVDTEQYQEAARCGTRQSPDFN
jgi:NADP-dependent 3-hydroxy acid dehydrogenase YdfG